MNKRRVLRLVAMMVEGALVGALVGSYLSRHICIAWVW